MASPGSCLRWIMPTSGSASWQRAEIYDCKPDGNGWLDFSARMKNVQLILSRTVDGHTAYTKKAMNAEEIILVTGAAGFIGRHVCDRLTQGGVAFLGIDHHLPLHAGSELRACDISDTEAVVQLFRQYAVGVVIHLAAVLPSAARSDPEAATRVNVTASTQLLEAAVRAGVRRFAFASSMSVYGSWGSKHVFREDDATGPVDLYGMAKRYVEVYGELLSNQGALSFVALRIAGVVGAGAHSATSAWRSEIFEKLGTGAPQKVVLPFHQDSTLSLVHVEDVADMLVLLAQQENLRWPIYNTPAENWPIQDLKRSLQALDPNISVDLPSVNGKPAPALSDGARFSAELGYSLGPLQARFARAVLRPVPEQKTKA